MSWLPPSLQNWNPNTKRPVAPPISAGGANARFQHSSLPSAHTSRQSQQQSDPRSRQSTGGMMSRSFSQSAVYSSTSKPVPVRSSTVAPTSRLPPNNNVASRPSFQPLQRTNSGGGSNAYSQQPSTSSYADNYHSSTSSLPRTQGMQLHGNHNNSGSFSQGFSLKKKSLPPPSRGVSQQQQQPALPRHLCSLPSSADEETQLSLLLAPRESSTAILNPFHHQLPTTATISLKAERSSSAAADDETQDDDPPIAVPPRQEAPPTTAQVVTGVKRPRVEDEELSRLLSELADTNEITVSALKSHKETVTAMQLRITELEKDVRTVTFAFISCRTELDRERERTTDTALTALIAKQVDVACTRVVPKLLTSNILFPKVAPTNTAAPIRPPVFKTVAKAMCSESDEEEGAAYC